MADTNKYPFADTSLAKFITRKADELSIRHKNPLNQREISNMLGYKNGNMISMFKRGEVKVPLDKAPDLAKIFEVEPALIFRMALEQYWPDNRGALAAMFDKSMSMNELKIVQYLRAASGNSDPELTDRLKTAITNALHFESKSKVREPA